jgi:RHS repeat-associated protein
MPLRADYSSFGEVTGTGLSWMPFGFAGGIYDGDTRLVQFGARDYDPLVGRWTRKDPLRFDADGNNLYGYALLDPINTVDPTGNNPVVIVLTGCALAPEVCAAILAGGALAAAIVGHELGKLLDKAPANDNCKPKPTDPCYQKYLEETAYCGETYPDDRRYDICMDNARKRYLRCLNGLPPDGPLVPW